MLQGLEVTECMNRYTDIEARFQYIKNILPQATKHNEPEILKQICINLDKDFTRDKIAKIIEENILYLKIPLMYCIDNNDRESCIKLLNLGAHIPDDSRGKIRLQNEGLIS